MIGTTSRFLTAMLLCVGVTSWSHGNHIDFIVDGGFILTTTSTSGAASASQLGDGGNILGAEREVTIDFAAGGGILSTGTLSVPVGPGPVGPDTSKVLLLANSVDSFGTLTLTYDGVGSAGLGGSNFDTNWDFIAVSVPGLQGSGNLSVTATDTSSNSGTLSGGIAAAGNYFFPFTSAAYAGVDFTMIDSVVVNFETTTAATDLAISQITREADLDPTGTILPEPNTLVLASVSLLALARRRR